MPIRCQRPSLNHPHLPTSAIDHLQDPIKLYLPSHLPSHLPMVEFQATHPLPRSKYPSHPNSKWLLPTQFQLHRLPKLLINDCVPFQLTPIASYL
jgi:hypothetical protein